MSNAHRFRIDRRSMLKSSLGLLAGGAVACVAEAAAGDQECEPRLESVEPEDHRYALCGDRQAGAEPVRTDSH